MKYLNLTLTCVAAAAAVNLFAAHPKTVELAANSVDELQAKITAAGPGGTVLIKAGAHRENSTVTITHPVTLRGESGAGLFSGIVPDLALPAVVIPAIHVLGTREVTITGLSFAPASELLGFPVANCAVLIENSSSVHVVDNQISAFRMGILIQHGDHTLVQGNIIQTSHLWTTLPPIMASPYIGIFSLNGQHNRIVGNQVSQSLFGIFGNDLHGQIRGNTSVGNYVGIILCNAQPLFVVSGQQVGAEHPSTYWHVEGNDSSHNALVGYLVIDGANHNVLNNNSASGNGWVDLHLVGNTDFFGVGIVFPASYNNLVTIGSAKGLSVLDCGDQNTVVGDATVVPCP